MNRINPDKLKLSKWTAVSPQNREKHFLVIGLLIDEEGAVERCVLEAVMTKKEYVIPWQQLKDSGCWKLGWR